jgi:nucleoid DNA-binding protein
VGRKRTGRSAWAEQRRGFKHELILTLFDLGYTYSKAKEVIETIISSIKAALARKEEVVIDGFGAWKIAKCTSPRAWRFGKVIVEKTYRVNFRCDEDAFFHPSTRSVWKPHPGWKKTRKRSQALRGRKLAEFQRQQAKAREQALLDRYVKIIVDFFMREIQGEDWRMIWMLRFNNSQWYWGEVEQTRSVTKRLRSIKEAEQVIKETEPSKLPRDSNNRVIALIQWYARWTAEIDVDRKLWEFAERRAREKLRRVGG